MVLVLMGVLGTKLLASLGLILTIMVAIVMEIVLITHATSLVVINYIKKNFENQKAHRLYDALFYIVILTLIRH